MTTILITGATGFIGKRIAESLLGEGASVRALTRRDDLPGSIGGAKILQGDLTTMSHAEAVSAVQDVDVVVHCAGELSKASDMRGLHVGGTRTLARAAAGRVSTWIQLSSAGALGPHTAGLINEDHKSRPVGEYETTKAEADDVVWETLDGTGTRCVILLPTIVFDKEMPNESLRRLVRAAGLVPFLILPDKLAQANYVHVDDVATAVRCAIASTVSGRFLVADSVPLAVFLEEALRAMGQAKQVRALPGFFAEPIRGIVLHRTDGQGIMRYLAALMNRAVYSSARAAEDLGWRPDVGWRSGIQECAAAWAGVEP